MKLMTEGESAIYFYAFRYCFGRMSYCVADYIQEAIRHIKRMHTHDLKPMDKEISDAKVMDDTQPDPHWKTMGMSRDRNNWLQFQQTIQKELKRRKYALA